MPRKINYKIDKVNKIMNKNRKISDSHLGVHDQTLPIIVSILLFTCSLALLCSFMHTIKIYRNNAVSDQHNVKLLNESISVLTSENTKLNKLLVPHVRQVRVSFYSPVLGGINGTVGKSASGKKLRDGWSIAVSRDLIDDGWYGRKIDLYGSNLPTKWRGVHYSADKMAIKNPYTKKEITNQIDIYVSDPSMIPSIGIYNNVFISKILPEGE